MHVTSLPDEAAPHADTIFLGPGDHTWTQFLRDYRAGCPAPRYEGGERNIAHLPPIRRDLIKRGRYLVPNSIVVTRGCPHHCEFCYKDAFFAGGRSFYTQPVDAALAEIDRLPGRHLYFLDDHLLGHQRFAAELFTGMRGMGRLFQGASTVDAILRGDLIERAADAGLRSLFVGFETLSESNLRQSRKTQNLNKDYSAAILRLHDLGIMINGSFVFGLDDDGPDVFKRTVDWAVANGLTTCTFHILTPYPGTALYEKMDRAGRIVTRDWDRYDTRHVVYRTTGLTPEQLEAGYHWAYRAFYTYPNIVRASLQHDQLKHIAKHALYAAGWKRFEWLWNFLIKTGAVGTMRPMLEAVLSQVRRKPSAGTRETEPLVKLTVRSSDAVDQVA